MNEQQKEILRLYMQIMQSPLMRWLFWISLASVVIVCVIAWRRGLSIWSWFLYAMLLGPIALVHILVKNRPREPAETA